MYSVHWSTLAEITFSEKIEFIFKKWNQKEVDKFGLLVEENLEKLSKNPSIGNCFSRKNVCAFVLSKQTTLYYKITVDELRIDLILFWNNLKNHNNLKKLL